MLWKILKENNNYEINEYGLVRRCNNKKIKQSTINHKGYTTIVLYYEGKATNYFIHRLVANNWLAEPSDKLKEWAKTTHYKIVQVNHKDGNKQNNHHSNLEWVDASENIIHSKDVLKSIHMQPGHINPFSKLTEDDDRYILANYKYGDNNFGERGLARHFNVSQCTIKRRLKILKLKK